MSRRFVVKGKSLWKQVIVEKFREEVCEWCSIGMRKDLRQGMASNKKTLGRLTLKLNQFYGGRWEDIDIATIKKETLDLGESMLFPFKVELMLPTPLERLSQASMEFYGITALCLP
ncbi:hypothetical protein CK203_056979 [Vitis vinifera]|uniref:Uncharacterized protein n=1 Tax=Vitis vinifera TaxID=29760 RepID=A0A438GN62_VITVI|nr:hypothetical protein CK203_056979 [Vitis vinifera]